MNRNHVLLPMAMATLAVASLSLMDAYMKSAALAVGALTAAWLRSAIATGIALPLWLARGGRWPGKQVLKLHLQRSVVATFMALTFFYALTTLPLAEAIAISFVAPLIALYLSAILLGEQIERRAVVAALLGLAGVIVIVGDRLGRQTMTDDAAKGLALIGISAILYAWNLVLQRQQALVAGPAEVSTFQNGIVTLVLLAGAPFLLEWPETRAWLEIGAGALLAVGAALFFAWAYARAQAQQLVTIEYTGFLWASLFGWLYFGEGVSGTTIIGALLIVAGCWIATRRRRPEQTAL